MSAPLLHSSLHQGEWRLVRGLQVVLIARKLKKTTLLAFLRENGTEPNATSTKDVLSRLVVDLARSMTSDDLDREDEAWNCPCDVIIEDFLQNEAFSSLPAHLQDLMRGMCNDIGSNIANFLTDYGELVKSDCRVVLLKQLQKLLLEQAGALPISPLAMTSSGGNGTSPPMAIAPCEDTKVPSPIPGTSKDYTTPTLTITSLVNNTKNISKVTITPDTVKIESPNVIATITTNNKSDTPTSTYTITLGTPKQNNNETDSPIRVTPPKINNNDEMTQIKAPKRPSPKAIIKAGAIVVTDIIASSMYATSATLMYGAVLGQNNLPRPLATTLPTTARTSLMVDGYVRPWNVPGLSNKRMVTKRKSGASADYMKPTLSSANKVRDRPSGAEGPQVKVKGHPPLCPLLPEGNECCVCLSNKREVAFNPCGHTICCKTCAEPLRKCPMCRKDISVVLTLYMS